jgi:hypothetical protein
MKFRFLLPLVVSVVCLPVVCVAGPGQVHLIVTAEGHSGSAPPLLSKDQVELRVDRKPAHVDDWAALRGAEANLELYVVIDDGESSDLALQYGDLKNFMSSQPATTRIGLAYLSNGEARIAVHPTADCAQVEKALRSPLSQPGIAASPYMGVSDLIKKWPATDARREVLLISSGIDPWGDNDPQNLYLLQAISAAQHAGVLVHAFYFSSAGHLGHSLWNLRWGQNYLSELCEETGGEFYWLGDTSPVSFIPWLKDLKLRLENQYLLTLDAPPGKQQNESVKIASTLPGVSLECASRVFAVR